MMCQNGEGMAMVYSNDLLPTGDLRVLVWRCTKHGCCNQSGVSVRHQSFFAFKRAPLVTHFMVLYFWLAKCSNETINMLTSAHPTTIGELMIDFQHMYSNDKLTGDRRGLVWICNRHSCCRQSRVFVREHSYFAFRTIDLTAQCMVLYYYLAKCSNQTIEMVTGINLATICSLIIDFQYMMEGGQLTSVNRKS